MIDINYLTDNLEFVINKLTNRGQDFTYLKEAVLLNNERKELILKLEEKQQEHNKSSKKMISVLKLNNSEVIDALKSSLASNKKLIATLSNQLSSIETKIRDILLKTPNIPCDSTPLGNSENDNVEVRKHGKINSFNTKPHWEIATELNLINFEQATKITGSRYVIYQKEAALLFRALINFLLDFHYENDYQEVVLPTIVNEKSLITSGNLPKFKEDLFQLKDENFYLIPTAEVPLVSIHAESILNSKQLPIKYCAYTSCYRSEAGAAGKDTRGIIRLHEFHKVELVKFTKPMQSKMELEELTNEVAKILELLELPYRIIELCTADLGFHANKTYDIEVWMPSQNKYREISSCSNCGDYQARRGLIRYKENEQEKTQLVHTLNGSGLAIDRLIAAILENNYQEDGSVLVPALLQKYMHGLVRISN